MRAAFNFKRRKAFGWLLHHKQLAKGDTYRAHIEQDMMPADTQNVTLWTAGRIEGIRDDGLATKPRVYGDFSLDRPMMMAGDYTLTAIEASEWWCINHVANRRQLPELQAFRATGTAILEQGTRLLVCAGQLETTQGILQPGDTVHAASGIAQVRAIDGPVLGLLFDRERNT